MSFASINTRDLAAYPRAYPLARVLPVVSAMSILAVVPLWNIDAILTTLRPLGGALDTSIAQWVVLLSVPIGILIAATATPVLRARGRAMGELAYVEGTMGSHGAALVAAASVVEHLVTYTLCAAVFSHIIVTAWSSLTGSATPIAICCALVVAMTATLGVRRRYIVGAVATVATVVATLGLVHIVGHVSPFWLTSSAQDLADVSREVVTRSDSAVRLATALLAAATLAVCPAIMMRYITVDLTNFSRPRSVHAATVLVSVAIASTLVTYGVAVNVADVDASAFVSRQSSVFSMLHILAVPAWLRWFYAVTAAIATLVAARTVLDSMRRVHRQMMSIELLPRHFARMTDVTGGTALGVAVVSAVLLAVTEASPTMLAMPLVFTGFVTLALTRFCALTYWGAALRREGNAHRRSSMKRSRAFAILGVVVAIAILMSFVVADMTNGAWAAVVTIAVLYLVFYSTRRRIIAASLDTRERSHRSPDLPSRVHYIILAPDMREGVSRAVRWVRACRPYSVELLHIDQDGDGAEVMKDQWAHAGVPIDLTVVSAQRTRPSAAIIDHVRRFRAEDPSRVVNVVFPVPVERSGRRGIGYSLETRRVERLLAREPGVMTTRVPWMHMGESMSEGSA